MTRKLLYLILLFGLLWQTDCVIAIGKWKVSSYDEETVAKKVGSSSKGKKIDIEIQRQVAVHEAGHAIARAILFGEDEVANIVVNTCVDEDDNLGHVNWVNRITRRHTLDTMRRAAVVYLAARSADTKINGSPVSGSYSDLKKANTYIWNSYILYGLAGSPITYKSRSDAPAHIREKVERDILDAEKYADELVAANIEAIKALAEDIMGITPKDGERVMETDAFKAFCELHVLVDPRTEPLPKKSE